jgi:hypothetical protein
MNNREDIEKNIMPKISIPKVVSHKVVSHKVIDVFGEYEPIIRCTCIDERTLTNINHSLEILYSDKMREQKELKEIKNPSPLENDAMDINDLVMRRTNSLMETLKEIKPCPDIKSSN